MDKQTDVQSPEFQQFLQQVEAALMKSAAEAKRIAEQTGTRLIIRETFVAEGSAVQDGNSATVSRGEEHHSGE